MDKSHLRNIELFLFDMDGTLYLGNTLFDFTNKLLKEIRSKNKKYLFITNNSSKSVTAYVEKLKSLGIEAKEEDFLTSSQATALYLHQNCEGKKIYVCGTKSLKEELIENGFSLTESVKETECVVVGYDTELTYKKLVDVCEILSTKNVPYIATNPDYVCPTEFGSVPDCGSICDMISNAVKKLPIVIGKPAPEMIYLAMKKANVTPDKTAVIGDRIYTDVKSGINAGALGVLVLSGETNREILKQSDVTPDIVLEDAGEILNYL